MVAAGWRSGPMRQLTHRRVSENGYRISTGGVEIGSVSLMQRHTKNMRPYWHWGIDVMPLMDHGGRPPQGDVDNLEAGFHEALAAFKKAFTTWHAKIDPELWRENLDHKRDAAERLRR